jgi:hypothetical protein
MGPADVTEGAHSEAQGEVEKKGGLEFDGPAVELKKGNLLEIDAVSDIGFPRLFVPLLPRHSTSNHQLPKWFFGGLKRKTLTL